MNNSNIKLLRDKAKQLMQDQADYIESIEIVFSNDKDYGFQNNQKLGKYQPLQKRITLYNVFEKYTLVELGIDVIFPTYMHELVHALQHKYCGTILYLLALGLARPLLQKHAREIEDSFYK